MADLTFNTTPGQTIERNLLLLFLNTGTAEVPVWSVIGKRVEDSSAEYDWSRESKTDILGSVWTTMKKPIITQSFDPCELDASDNAQVKLWNLGVKEQNPAALANLDMLVVHCYAGEVNKSMFAERYSASSVEPTGLGGASNIGMPITVTFGGTRTVGTVEMAAGVPTFTADTAA